MRWIYGKQDWKTLERGEENCYLLTNGLGGFSSTTVTGAVARNDHSILMACLKAPNYRVQLLHRLKEELKLDSEAFTLSTQEFVDQPPERGDRYLSTFVYEDYPQWRFHIQGAEIIKEIVMEEEKNTIVIRYRVDNRSGQECRLTVTPFFQFSAKGKDIKKNQKISFYEKVKLVESNGIQLFLRTNGVVEKVPELRECYYYRYDDCDGRREYGNALANHTISISVQADESRVLDIIYEMESSANSADTFFQKWREQQRERLQQAGFQSPTANALVRSAMQFLSQRESTEGTTILAGYPFFEDWGRDTMIALPGICLATKQYEKAKSILQTFAVHEKDGLMPNLFPEGENSPLYNTVDAALLFINCVYLYYMQVKDKLFLKEMYPVMHSIIQHYQDGTHYGIHMDEDGLIQAGEGLAQVTWMDVRVGDVLPTPRHGKPVEINAYWYNALKIMEKTVQILSVDDAYPYSKMAEQVKDSFVEQFWRADQKCLKDLVSGSSADLQIRCNQIWAVSLPFTMLDREQEKQVVEMVFRKLYTPYGLRTLEMSDEEFHPVYRGPMEKRDMAYHQGTVWVYPLGAYYLAYLKVHDYNETAKQKVWEQLEALESAMREGCIGQLPEIYDGENPVSSKGCFAQAWSVGEILQVYAALGDNR